MQAWRTATWTVPISTQLVLAINFVILWLLGKTTYFADSHERGWFLTGTLITAFAMLPPIGLLLVSDSSRVRGVGLAVAGSSAMVVIGCIAYGFWIFRW